MKHFARFFFTTLFVLGVVFSFSHNASAAVGRDVTITSVQTTPYSIKFEGYADVTHPGSLKIKSAWGQVGATPAAQADDIPYSPANDSLPNVSYMLVDKTVANPGTQYTFTYLVSNLEPNRNYKFIFYHVPDPLSILYETTAHTDIINAADGEVEIRKPSGAYGDTPDIEVEDITSTSVHFTGKLRVAVPGNLALRFSYIKQGTSTPVHTTKGFFQDGVAPGQEYTLDATVDGLTQNTSYLFSLNDSVTGHVYWSDYVAILPDGAVTGSTFYGTATIAESASHLRITPKSDEFYNTSNKTYLRYVDATALNNGTFGVKVAWGEHKDQLLNLHTTAYLHGSTTQFSNTLFSLGETKQLDVTIAPTDVGKTYWFTLVDPADPTKAYMDPISFTITSTLATPPKSATPAVYKPLVAPGELVPCDGGVGDECKFPHAMRLINNIIKFFIALALPAAALAFAYIGWLFMAKGGSEEARHKAKHIAMNLVIGIICILGAWLIVNTILDTFLDSSTASDYKLLEQTQ